MGKLNLGELKSWLKAPQLATGRAVLKPGALLHLASCSLGQPCFHSAYQFQRTGFEPGTDFLGDGGREPLASQA